MSHHLILFHLLKQATNLVLRIVPEVRALLEQLWFYEPQTPIVPKCGYGISSLLIRIAWMGHSSAMAMLLKGQLSG